MRGATDRASVPGARVRAPTLRILRKDLAALRPGHRGLIALVYVMAALQAVRVDEALFILGVLLAFTLAIAVPVIEWRLGTDRLLASLPVRRSELVRARYAGAGLAVVLAWAAWVATGAILAPLLAAGRPRPDSWTAAEGHLAFLVLCVGLLSLFLPLFFRLGLGRAATVFMPLVAALYALAAVGAEAVRGGTGLVPPGALARSLLAAQAAALGWPAVAAGALLVLAALVLLSIRLSTGAFRRRDL